MQGLLEEENGGRDLDLLEEQVPVGESERESETSVLFLNISTDQEDDSSEKQMELATEKVNLAMQNLNTSTSSSSSQEPSVEKCKDCHFNAQSKYEMKQHRIKSHKKSTAIDTMKKSSRKKFSTKRSCNEYSDSYLDEILNDY